MIKYLRISSYIRKSFLTYDFATDFLIFDENFDFFFISAVGLTFRIECHETGASSVR
jgi:hypothetical protein